MRRSYRTVGLLLCSYNAIISNYQGFSYSPKVLRFASRVIRRQASYGRITGLCAHLLQSTKPAIPTPKILKSVDKFLSVKIWPMYIR